MTTNRKPASLPSNIFYAQLNRRFDKRLKLLARFGFMYSLITAPMPTGNIGNYHATIAVVWRWRLGKIQTIQPAEIMQACPRVWREIILQHYCR